MSLRSAAALLLAAVVVGLAGCARSDLLRTPPDPGHPTAMDSGRDIVLAVDNPLDPPSIHAGSSLLGYTVGRNYGAGRRANDLLASLQRQYGWQQVAGWPIDSLGVYCIVLAPPPGTSREALLHVLTQDQRVQLAQPLQDYSVYASHDEPPRHYNDPYVDLQRGFVGTEAALAHDAGDGKGVRVAVVDTGVDLDHPELRGRIGEAQNLVNDDGKAFRGDRHGTEVAGIIAAAANNGRGIVGMAPGATLSVYKACWYPASMADGARCNSFTLAKALAAVADTDARIINLSLGGPADPLLRRLLEKLLARGDIAIAALPPGGNTHGFPDDVPGVIVVRTTANTPAPPGVLSAPGVDILSTEPGGGYDFSSGSSMATAHVSGIAALLLSIAPGLDAATVHDILLQSSRTGPDGTQVDAARAVALLMGRRGQPRGSGAPVPGGASNQAPRR
jgi:subtilisin family serine protease